jgi:hypothetical protein
MLSVVALVLGIISGLGLLLLTICLPLSLPASIGAIIVGAIARRNVMADPQRYSGHGIATTGFGIGCVVFLIWATLIFFNIGMLTHYFHSEPKPTTLSAGDIQIIRDADRDNMDKILHVLIPLADKDPAGEYPKHLAASYPEIKYPEKYISTLSGTKPMLPPDDPKNPSSYETALDQHTDFVYTGADLTKTATNNRQLIVMYSKNIYPDQARLVGFADAHVELVTSDELGGLFALSNKHREVLKLQPFWVDGWIPGTKVNTTPKPPEKGPDVAQPQPAAEPLHLTFATIEEALKYLQTGKTEEKKAAMDYIVAEKPAAASHDKVVPAMKALLADNTFHADAMKVYLEWVTKADIVSVRGVFDPLQKNAQGADAADAKALIKKLGAFADKESAPNIAKFLAHPALRDDAVAALIALGPDSEESVQPLVDDASPDIAKAALKVLEKVGTEKSMLALHRGLGSKTTDVPKLAEETMTEIATRLNLKPEQYLYALYNRYTVEAPTGFLPDNVFSKPNSKQWTRTLPGRSVKSTYTVAVKFVGKDFQITAPADTLTLNAGPLTLKQIDMQTSAGNIQQMRHFQALDGEYLVDLVVVLDNSDNQASKFMSDAAQKIRPKPQ